MRMVVMCSSKNIVCSIQVRLSIERHYASGIRSPKCIPISFFITDYNAIRLQSYVLCCLVSFFRFMQRWKGKTNLNKIKSTKTNEATWFGVKRTKNPNDSLKLKNVIKHFKIFFFHVDASKQRWNIHFVCIKLMNATLFEYFHVDIVFPFGMQFGAFHWFSSKILHAWIFLLTAFTLYVTCDSNIDAAYVLTAHACVFRILSIFGNMSLLS